MKFGGDTMLHLTLQNGHVRALQSFLEHFDCKRALKAENSMGNTPMHSLAFNITSTRDEFEQIFELLHCQQLPANSVRGQRGALGADGSPSKNAAPIKYHPRNTKPPPRGKRNKAGMTAHDLVLQRILDQNPFDITLSEIQLVADKFKPPKKQSSDQ